MIVHRADGTDPDNEFTARFRLLNPDKPPRDAGIVPVTLLILTSRAFSDVRRPRSDVIVPDTDGVCMLIATPVMTPSLHTTPCHWDRELEQIRVLAGKRRRFQRRGEGTHYLVASQQHRRRL